MADTLDNILTLMAIVSKLTELHDHSKDGTERDHLFDIITEFESYIEYKTEEMAKTIQDPENTKTVMYQMLNLITQHDEDVVDGIWIPDESEEMPGGFSTN